MKYGMRERISGAVILLALAVIFIPMLFDDPPERDERPEPMLTIEQPIDIERQPVAEPEPPASLSEEPAPQPAESQPPAAQAPEPDPQPEPTPGLDPLPQNTEPATRPETAPETQQDTQNDPIAELTREAEQQPSGMPPVAENGEWAVQVGSFGEPGNAERLEKQLDDQGFTAYRQPRDNDLTTVYVGPFASSEAGEQARTVLKEKVNIQGLLIRIQEGE